MAVDAVRTVAGGQLRSWGRRRKGVAEARLVGHGRGLAPGQCGQIACEWGYVGRVGLSPTARSGFLILRPPAGLARVSRSCLPIFASRMRVMRRPPERREARTRSSHSPRLRRERRGADTETDARFLGRTPNRADQK